MSSPNSTRKVSPSTPTPCHFLKVKSLEHSWTPRNLSSHHKYRNTLRRINKRQMHTLWLWMKIQSRRIQAAEEEMTKYAQMEAAAARKPTSLSAPPPPRTTQNSTSLGRKSKPCNVEVGTPPPRIILNTTSSERKLKPCKARWKKQRL